ncbi:HemK2/MTQ2 family protein methyltransferase [Streptomyces sp. ML-6]|uniref:HemK2/MTQ2 family protein methyltransferase n=1 Tax=Streptomyces sp. ML-6 TaxID=2982693 RepID=UPI0024C087BE|nr:HemK2/MTQ2 family protein methyltransferase [Streptomyces sp. ML-6]MDK0518335.1 methyltransferase [Streptomyces sp. ML-6]
MAGETDGTRPFSQPFLVTLPGVYAPQSDTRLLLAALERERVGPGTAVLDVGTGSGALAVRAAQLGCEVTAVDVALRAVITARLNAMLHRRRITVRRSDLMSAVRTRSYDLILCNPPYVPAPDIPRHGASRAWNAGSDGRAVVDRLCTTVPSMLRRGGGVLLLVHSGLCDPDATLNRLRRAGLDAAVSSRVRIPFGPVLLSRLRWLREHRLIRTDDTNEELVVIRAERP